MTLRQLRHRAPTDKKAAEELWDRYTKMSDSELRRRAAPSIGDETARAVLRNRTPSNATDLAEAVESTFRPPHHATVVVSRGGVEISRTELVSGNRTPEEAALPYPARVDETHTEARAVRHANLRPGDVMTIFGQYNPCGPCQRAMREAANRTGATIEYLWLGGQMTFRPASGGPVPGGPPPVRPPLPTPPSSSRFSGAQRAVAGAVGAIVAVNEVLSSVNRARGQANRNIAMGNAEFAFWTWVGANPTMGVWDVWSQAPLPPGSTASVSTFGSSSWPYVVDIDVGAFRRNLPRVIRSYQDFLHFVDVARQLDAIELSPAIPDEPDAAQRMRAEQVRYYATVSKNDRAKRRRYDLTDVIAPIRAKALADLDAEMRAEAAGFTATQRHQVFRLKHGAETKIYRAAHKGGRGRGPQQRIISSQRLFGPDPWVRVVGPEHDVGGWFSTDIRTRVTPANADAERSALVSAYWVGADIDDVLDEVQAAGRPILDRQPKTGRIIESFVAGPKPGDGRFGATRYYRNPDPTARLTAAVGELNEFWVDRDDLVPVPPAELARYIR
ncbi:hypothetical protein [Amycolatopsis nigrescens]|uniref:hypothetical protein n=1 Tax=Amycolatopsis nigrescens TaxID=381445 RepID=UPI00146B35CA|nr:hypothetical protein [Amycolatopsis nigrescens]